MTKQAARSDAQLGIDDKQERFIPQEKSFWLRWLI